MASLVGVGFPAMVRVCNPAYRIVDGGGVPVRWREMAAARGVKVDLASCSFFDAAGVRLHSGDAGAGWEIEPRVGGDPRVLVEVVSVLRRFTADPARVGMGVWDGYAGLRDRFPGTMRVGRLAYHPTVGPLGCVVDPTGWGYPANLAWTGEWLMVSDVDLPSTYVAGSEELAAALVSDGDLEAVRVDRDTPVDEPA